jgi:hypothetical protein
MLETPFMILVWQSRSLIRIAKWESEATPAPVTIQHGNASVFAVMVMRGTQGRSHHL